MNRTELIEATAMMRRAIEILEAMPTPEPTDRDKTRAALALARRNRSRTPRAIRQAR